MFTNFLGAFFSGRRAWNLRATNELLVTGALPLASLAVPVPSYQLVNPILDPFHRRLTLSAHPIKHISAISQGGLGYGYARLDLVSLAARQFLKDRICIRLDCGDEVAGLG